MMARERWRAFFDHCSAGLKPPGAKSLTSSQEADDDVPADRVAADALLAAPGGGAADERSVAPGDGLGVASRASQPDLPNPRRASCENHSGTSQGRAIRESTSSNGGRPI
jgi:hypothetical protein